MIQVRLLVTSHGCQPKFLYASLEQLFSGRCISLQELGPRFTLRLLSVQLGVFNPGHGDYEFKEDYKRTGKDRRRFIL